MMRSVSMTEARRAAQWAAWLAMVLLVVTGCSTTGLQHRAQAEDDSELHRYDIATVGDRTAVGNAEPVPIGGVGLVEGLEGTGGDCAHDNYRAMLLEQLTKDRVANAPQLLKSSDCALVIIDAFLPPGAAKDDTIDVTVKLPPGSKATSLRGGTLRRCYLHNYDFAKNLRPDYKGNAGMMIGYKVAIARGPVLVGAVEGEDSANAKTGRIWGGGKVLKDYPLALVMNQDSQQARFTSLIADRINATFEGNNLRSALDSRIASAQENMAVALRVPSQYRLNIPRFLRVVRLIPLTDAADVPGKTESDRRSYRQLLADDLVDPSRTVVAALRLEALGNKSIAIFKDRGLKSTHPLVRFVSAEALAYLGSSSCGEELYQACTRYPLFRSFALTAMASLDEAICHLKLKELIVSNLDDEARIGAFRALHTLNERDPVVQGEHLNDAYWLHRVANDTKPFVHVSTSKRAEIVLFGKTPTLSGPFSFLAGEFAVTSTAGDDRCTVSRFPLGGEPARKQCGLELEAVLRTMSELGAQYPDVLALLQQANSCQSLSCRIRVDALPNVTDVHELVKAGKDQNELVPGGQDLGKTPTLFEGAAKETEDRGTH